MAPQKPGQYTHSLIPRAFLTCRHTITQRGNGRQVVFDTNAGRRLYLDLLRRNSEKFEMSVWAYCLMSNHVHSVAVPQNSEALARALGRTHAQYAQYLNLCRGSWGHVWQARYYSCPLGGHHVWNAMAYIERNPVRAGLIARAADYPWSSAAAHARGNEASGFLDLESWAYRYDGRSWSEMIQAGSQQPSDEQLRIATLRGRPYADEDTLADFERRLGRSLRPRPTGRKPKKTLAQSG